MEDNIKKELDNITNEIDSKIEKSSLSAIETMKAETDAVVKSSEENLASKITEINDRLDKSEIEAKKRFEASQPMSFKSALKDALNGGAIESFVKGNSRSARFDMKADMTVGADFTGDVIAPLRVPGVYNDPSRPQHFRQFIPVGSTQSDVIRYVKESGYTDGAGAKAEGNALGQTDFDLQAVDANVQLIGTYLRISKQMVEDYDQLSSYLSSRIPSKVLTAEDDQIVGGNGVSPNFLGLFNSGTAFDTSTNNPLADSVDNANEFDVLVASMNQLAINEYSADNIVLNPSDFHKILLLKDTQNNYLKDQVYQGLQPNFMGVPVILNTEIPSGQFLVANFAQSCQYWVRDNVSLEFFEQDSDNVQKNFITVRAQLRGALATYLPKGIIYGTFSTAKAALETP